MAAGVFIVLWSTITPAQIPFPSSDTLTGTNTFPSAGTTTVGFSIVNVNAEPSTLQLVKQSDDIIFLLDETQVVAGVVIFKSGDEMPLGAALNNSMEGGS